MLVRRPTQESQQTTTTIANTIQRPAKSTKTVCIALSLFFLVWSHFADICLAESIDHDERNRQCGQLWKKLDFAMQEKWKDSEFLQSFQSCSAGIGETDNLPNQPDQPNQPNQPNPKNRARTSFETDTWANKVVADVSSLFSHFNPSCMCFLGSTTLYHIFSCGT
jgi:hypothetical protein